MSQRIIVCLALLVVFVTQPVRSDDWFQFRGPHANGLAGSDELPIKWGANENIQWKVPIPGRGWSQPIVWGDKIFITTAVSEPGSSAVGRTQRQRGGRNRGPQPDFRWEVYCLNRHSGDILWKQVAMQGKPRQPTHRSNTFASETPVTDGKHLYVYFGMTGLFCFDLDGNPVWKKDLGAYPMQGNWGTSSSPALYDDSLYLQIDNQEDSFLVALDSATGDEKWRLARDEKSNWSSPIIWKNNRRTELVTAGSNKIRSYDPASGKVLWELDAGGGRSSSSAAGDGERLYVGTEGRDSGGFLFAINSTANGNITPRPGHSSSAGVAWSRPKAGPPMASPLVYQGYVYTLQRRSGIVNCYNAKTGELEYENRLPGAAAFWASPWAYDDMVFCLDDRGTTHVLGTGSELDVLAQNKLSEQFWSSAAIAGQTLLLRGANHLYCIRQMAAHSD